MAIRAAIITPSVDLHAHLASLFIQRVTCSGLPVTASRPSEKSVNAASMLMVMSLDIKRKEEVELSCDAENGGASLDKLAVSLAVDHDAKG